ncbi:MAG: glycogen synthase GlgA, partial [Rhodocyclaceae bacterium]|nr:glycogen synthase GlgA [Rhodocyclaceae bacterium]
PTRPDARRQGTAPAPPPPARARAGAGLRVPAPPPPARPGAFPPPPETAPPPGGGGLRPPPPVRKPKTADGLRLWLVDYPAYFDRAGNPYLGPEGHDWLDNGVRFGLFSRVAAWLGSAANTLHWHPDIIHCNDWQAGLAPAYLHYLPEGRARSLITVHNLAFQGLFDHATLFELGLPDEAWSLHGVEYYGHLSFLKAGLQHADAITTVSPTYAREIQTEEEGMGMAGLLRHRAAVLTGIVNGIDTEAWNPTTDRHLAKAYDVAHLAAKKTNRDALRREMGLADEPDAMVLGIVSRLTHQKGLDLLPALMAVLLEMPIQLAVLGSGEKALEDEFRRLAIAHPSRFAVRIGFDEGLAHRIEAGADAFLMPSRFEPCGLNQMYSLRYGTPPIVRATGGLADTVTDGVDGFSFRDATPDALLDAIRRAHAAWCDGKRWRAMQKAGMARDLSWSGPAQQYLDLYKKLLAP